MPSDAVIDPRHREARYVEERLRARLLALQHHAVERAAGRGDLDAGRIRDLEDLLADASAQLTASEEAPRIAFRIRCALEERRDARRTVDESARAWLALHDHGVRAFGPTDDAVTRAHSFAIRYTRLRGGPAELDDGVSRYERQLQERRSRFGLHDQRTHITRTNLAVALRDRGSPDDFARARRILTEEIHDRTADFGPDDPVTWSALVIMAQTMLCQAESPPTGAVVRQALCEKALDILQPILRARQRRFGPSEVTLQATLVAAHAELLLSRVEPAAVRIRYVQAVADRTRIRLTPGWADCLLARALPPNDPRALASARAALAARRDYYPPHARQVRDAEQLVVRLASRRPSP
ncbi:conserved hypothetical protein [Frankia canadensis]|uniref:Uncharacterized protein n=1 Tax=Frankia canadensis TaxID=1836972 RepID=A0A2I2KL28_9ACTN|nr:hypothetical protein [Frankia canadensis]SNQ46354.1 conserved hypothetical protein [Frankia canadensis]SOU53644.1 conserved hypothetical protein [Frankia canadensis]